MGRLRNQLGGDPFWSDEEVLDHGFNFRPDWWRTRIPNDVWTASLHRLPDATGGRGYHRVTRADLLRARTDNPDDIVSLLVACYAWGTGDLGFRVGRRARAFTVSRPDVLADKLAGAVAVLRDSGPVAAYQALARSGRFNLPHLGPSFYTKFLYAADAASSGAPGRALILDRFVAIALIEVEHWEMPEAGPWHFDTYRRWLEFAHDEAAKESAEGMPVRPDAIEVAMFRKGQAIYRDRRR
ncbi:hypothetical protein AB0J74_11395 [Asanoa sp. NPDC049573]|uniref:8-oxoguanine DNA glycosylase OGG fold protein n=1 Tax=Asanoa sp. NPDC049573 TaxID=3155396 RepID=UPI00344A560C